ncbi:MBG domain-containing protein [Flavobacterium frigoris]|nr:MBG domain-containing protein [Flavobacterium frigoris]
MRRKLFYYFLLLCCVMLQQNIKAQTLTAGDIAFVGYDFGTTDGFSFIALKTLPAGETLYFTEEGWDGLAWGNVFEPHIEWIIPSGITCGTIVSIVETSANTFTVTGSSNAVTLLDPTGTATNFNLLGGDQIIAYQSASGVRPSTPNFIAAVHADYNVTNYNAVTTWNDTMPVNAGSESVVPTGLTNGVDCISLFPSPGPEVSNSKYTGTLTGTAVALRASINNPANWAHDGTTSLGILPSDYITPSVSCPVTVAPTVTTTSATGVGAVKATLGGNVTADGGATVTERGIVWATTANPTTANNKVAIGSGTGSFSSLVSSLPSATLINFRSYAINSVGTSYGANTTFTTNAVLSATTSQTNVSCNGGSNASATVTPAGGKTAYTYAWSPSGGSGATASGLTAGAYSCTITDGESSSIVKNFTITQSTAIAFTPASQTNVGCNGAATGAATVNAATGGAGGYTYDWTPGNPTGDGTPAVTGLTAGVWTCTVTDANSCASSQSFTVTQSSAIALTPASQTNVSCNGGSNGAATVNPATGGVGGYTYNWTPGNPTGDGTTSVSGLTAGVWTCTVTDANGCTKSQNFTVTQPSAIALTPASQTNVSCNGGSNGAATVNPATGGVGGYTYNWTPGNPTGDGTTSVSGLTAGTWTCMVTDANGCTKSQNFTVTQPTAITATTSQTNVSCNGGSNGSATVATSGGTAGYTYSWAPTGGTAATATGLSAGPYTVTITDANACTATKNFTITQPSTLLATAISQTNVSCNGSATGSATVVPSGGTAGYTYSWAPSGGTAATASGLYAGTYTVTITDANACTATTTFIITQPSALVATAISQTNVSCNGGSNGSATVAASGGTAGYTYSWSPSGGTAATATGLSAGTYTVTITDANACTATKNFIVTQPSAITATTSQTNVSCNGGSNGSATVSASGGTAGYTYSWSPSGGTAATATGLSAGTYTVTITDANACTATKNFIVTQPSAITATTSQTNVSCNGGSNGSASVTVSGGTPGYTYSWSPSGGTAATATGLVAGAYTVTITDANGCTATNNFTVTQATAITATTSQTNVACNGGSNGSASVTVSGGTPGYTYSWSPSGGTASAATGLVAGAYTVTVTDANGCTATNNFTITQPTAITASTSQTNVACNGGSNGSASVGVSGGTPGYTYSWSPSGGTAAAATGLAAGNYTVTITDANGCTITRSFTVTQPTALSFTTTTLPKYDYNTAYSQTIGVIGGTGVKTYMVTTGSLPVGFALSLNGTLTGISTQVADSNFTVTATDSNGCLATYNYILQLSQIPITVTANAVTKVYGDANPSLTYTVTPALLAGDSFTGNLVRTVGENVGTYAISVATLSAGSKYLMTYVPNNFAITAKPITVTANASQTKVYGAVEPSLTYSVSPTLVSGDSFIGSLTRTAGENAGSYAITQGSLSAGSNYNVTYVGANFSITKANQTISWSQTLGFDCDVAATAILTATSTSGLPISYTSSNANVAVVLNGVLTFTNFGSATITATQAGDGNYNAASVVTVPVEKSQPNLIRQQFDTVIFFDNSSNSFITYSWYKNGALVAGQTAQYFKDSEFLSGVYYAKATKADGTVVTACPLTFSPSIEQEYLKITPNPVRSNSSYQLITNVTPAKLQNARVMVFNILGTVIMDKVINESTIEMVAPVVEGIYIIKMTLANGKILIKNLLVKN